MTINSRTRVRALQILFLGVVLSSCSSVEKWEAPPSPPPPLPNIVLSETDIELVSGPAQPLEGDIKPPPTSAHENTIIRTFYATNRNATGSLEPYKAYGTQESSISYGVVDVSIPRDHRMGNMEAPFLGLRFLETPATHLMLMGVQTSTREQLLASIRSKVLASTGKSALVFIHGFTTSFEDAARRTAQLSYDLGFDGAPVFYSWPTQGKVPGYWDDEAIIKRATPKMKAFLADIFRETDAQNVYLIAHSMGNRGMAEAVAQLLDEQEELIKPRLKQLILTAPDIGVKEFEALSGTLVRVGAPVTLYASSKDKALTVSKAIHDMQRVGDTHHRVTIIKGIETIDATDVSTDFLGHSYFAENASVVSDMFYLFRTDLRPQHRFNMKAVSRTEGTYWKFQPGLCKP